MLTFEQFLNEHFVNIVDDDEKQKYKDQVWNILDLSYKNIGGVKGSGFQSPDDMVKNIPYWKLARKNGKIVACMLYKDKKGRKVVACGSDGTVEGKIQVKQMILDELRRERSYGEVSDNLMHYILHKLSNEEIEKYFIPAKKVGEILGKPVKITGKYTYVREIGGEQHEKMMFGKLHQKFKS